MKVLKEIRKRAKSKDLKIILPEANMDERVMKACCQILKEGLSKLVVFGKSDEFPKEVVQEKYRKIAASVSLFNMDSIQPFENGCEAPFTGVVETDRFVMFVLNTGWLCTQDQAVRHGKLKKEQLLLV